ncbi:hypothetical protein NECAME_05112 [Necator americanus]|uniref:Endoplasmic reticulum metallopeptidase 1-like C-terminal domain-containing protein n=1 Tax=Necator americanus TaxID=51031 RepID=W2SJI5_NECAM|nr:hypothetical protein NECAME_05112 [Necator americanus]ETN69789.1 hypothetical protein NECAME_05112 [Necator americanus]
MVISNFREYFIVGLDLAFVQNGYWWHTEFDEARRVTPGSLQRAGDNIYATLLHLLQSPYLENPAEFGDQKNVFFDFFGLFVVVYSEGVANAVHAILIVAVVVSTANHVRKHSEWRTVIVHLILNIPSYGMIVYLSELFLSIFIPIMGRIGSNPEVLVAIFTNITSYVVVLSLLSILTLTRTNRKQEETTLRNFVDMIAGILIAAAIVLLILCRLHKSPYNHSDSYPVARRIQLFHVNRALYNKDDGVKVRDSVLYVIAQDYRGAMDIPFVDENYTIPKCQYENPYCEIPLYFPTRSRIQDKLVEIPKRRKYNDPRLLCRHIRYRSFDDRPDIPGTKINMVHKEESGNRLSYDFLIKGSGQISVFLVPQSGWQIANCSISAPKMETDDHPLFLFLTCSGRNCGDWTFKVTLKHPGDPVKDDETQLLIGAASHYLHGPNMQSFTIKRILAEIAKNRQHDPTWSTTASAWNVDMIYRYF